jgi:hypothetical protein
MPSHFTVEIFGRDFIHDPIHHVTDVTGRHYNTVAQAFH